MSSVRSELRLLNSVIFVRLVGGDDKVFAERDREKQMGEREREKKEGSWRRRRVGWVE